MPGGVDKINGLNNKSILAKRPLCADIAQLVEHRIRNAGVVCSNQIVGTSEVCLVNAAQLANPLPLLTSRHSSAELECNAPLVQRPP